ncbi:MAG: SDR family oxidoreductase [Desulfobacteraceae bacterium]|jgi:NAD(P)-dependent dehydrogenase (short-subunit alcohol dehydrogenase family)|nr:SDR family oxidoreductase [Desulfobacteraceae bacterium]
MATVLVTGSNRGLGLEWVRQYAAEGWRVYATCRQPTEAGELRALGDREKGIRILRLDVTKPDEINALAVELIKEPIDVLINNAGVYLEKFMEVGLRRLRYEDWEYTFQVNTLGAVRVTEALQEHVARSEKRLVVVISTHMASIADIAAPGAYYYRSTKAALNAVMEGLTHELRPKGVGVLILHPGWVRTRMGGEGTSLMPPESVRGMRSLVEEFTLAESGRFFRYDGVEMPW